MLETAFVDEKIAAPKMFTHLFYLLRTKFPGSQR